MGMGYELTLYKLTKKLHALEVDVDSIDLPSLIDRTLTYPENERIILDYCAPLIRQRYAEPSSDEMEMAVIRATRRWMKYKKKHQDAAFVAEAFI